MQHEIDRTNNRIMNIRLQDPRNVGCGIIVVDKDNRILLGTRTDMDDDALEHMLEKRGELMWTLPGGGVEKYESVLQCAKRELKEEFDLTVREQTGWLKIIGYNNKYFLNSDGVKGKKDFTFITKLRGFVDISKLTPQEGEVGEIKAFTKEEVLDMIRKHKIYKASEMSLLMAMHLGYI